MDKHVLYQSEEDSIVLVSSEGEPERRGVIDFAPVTVWELYVNEVLAFTGKWVLQEKERRLNTGHVLPAKAKFSFLCNQCGRRLLTRWPKPNGDPAVHCKPCSLYLPTYAVPHYTYGLDGPPSPHFLKALEDLLLAGGAQPLPATLALSALADLLPHKVDFISSWETFERNLDELDY